MRRSVIIFAGAAAFSSPLLASEQQLRWPDESRLYLENDYFNWFTDQTDRYYTQGARVELLWHGQARDSNFLPGISHADWCSLVCGDDAAERRVDAGITFGQNMYTPADITIATPQPDDRPWAGYLYGSRIARISYDGPGNTQRQDRIEVSLGIVGPASLAGPTQDWWHGVINDERPEGWGNQLRNEPIVQLRYDTALRWPREENGGHFDGIARVRGNLGNALISLEAEAILRIGWNLSGFGVQTIPSGAPRAAAAMTGHTSALTGTRWLESANLFLRAGIKAVAHNITLDGNTFARNDIRINRTPIVPEMAVGVEFNLVGPFWLTFQFIHRGSEFETPRGRAAPAQEFGSFTLAWMTGK